MKQHVRTMWHKLVSLVKEGEVYLTAPVGGTALHWSGFDPNVKAMNWLLGEFSKLPKFVIDDDLLELVMTGGYEHSLLAMKKADVLRAPFPAMIVEFNYGSSHYLVMLRDQGDIDTFKLPWEYQNNPDNKADTDFKKKPFYGIVFRIANDEEGGYAVLAPSVLGLDLEERDGIPQIGMIAQSLDLFPKSPELDAVVKSTWQKDAAAVWRAVASAMLVMHTGGVKREVIECAKLNKHRVKSNKPPIPRHIVLSIGKVYRSNRSEVADDYDPRKSPRPHWRRGYDQPVRYGPGRAKIKQVYVPPKLVAFHGDMKDAPLPSGEYIVTK